MTDKPLTTEELEWFDSVEPPSSWCKSDMWERFIAAARTSVECRERVTEAENRQGLAEIELDHWKAIAQAHNDSLVERIAENERLNTELNHEQMDSMTGRQMVGELRAENERLREALEKIADCDDRDFLANRIARAALQSKGE
jgi:hypothetical protein